MRPSRLLPALAAGLALWGQAPAPPAPAVRPDLKTDEGGLWALADREEQRLRQSPLLVRDEALRAYVQKLAERLVGPGVPPVRTYVLEIPAFNANMAPNGMMQVWTGLLLRCENEAQLVAILGHEIAHCTLKHGLEGLRDAKSRTAWATVMLAVPVAGPLVSLGTLAGGFAYSRTQERSADALGLELMAKAGYPPGEAAKIWANLAEEMQAEKEAGGEPAKRSRLFATHPPEAERQKALEEGAARLGAGGQDAGAERYRALVAPFRMAWMEAELKHRRFGETLALLARCLRADPRDGLARYFEGEVYRIRNQEGDAAKALAAFEAAAGIPGAPPEAHRALGRLHRKAGRKPEMRAAYARYLELRPGAEDADMIKSYLEEP
ncbi:MAG TPA: M48 family metallopeptidase [Holophaga sp.]|nr:M48 family metallopeptidase [Holophaga sp.]